MELHRVSHVFGPRRVLHELSFSVAPGRIFALLGPNGAGKTTVLRLLAGLLVPTDGEVRVLGGDPVEPAVRAGIGWIPAGERTFYLRISALENLLFFARLQGMPRRAARRRAEELLVAVGLEGRGHDRVRTYSQGMQRRLAVARGLMHEPDLLLVDEATHDLDPEGAERIRGVVRAAAQRGTTVVWATQRIDEVRDFADSVLLLVDGRTRFCGSVPELVAHADRRRFLLAVANGRSDHETLHRMRRALGADAAVELDRGGGQGRFVLNLAPEAVLGRAIACLARAGIEVTSCHEQRSEVEEAFQRLVDGEPTG